MKKKPQTQCQCELDAVMTEFHEVMDKKPHCYEREENEDKTCDCAYFYQKYLDVKAKYKAKT